MVCEDVSLLKRVVDERLSLSKLQRSAMSSLSSSLHSSHHKSLASSDRTTEDGTTEAIQSPSWTCSDRTTEAIESPEKRTMEVSDDDTNKGVLKSVNSKEDGDGWELCFAEDVQE